MWNSLRSNRIKLVSSIVGLLFFLLISSAYLNRAFSLHFVDEEESMAAGRYLLDGERLYSDLFLQHQPLPYIASAGLQKLFAPNSIYLLIKRHREAVVVYCALWGMVLLATFGPALLPVILIYELLKFYLLGNLFLAEALVVYPLIFLLSSLFLTKPTQSKLQVATLGLVFGLCFLLYAPLWPLLALVLLLYLKKNTKVGIVHFSLFFFLGVLVPFFISLPFMSLKEYIFTSFYINPRLYIPLISPEPQSVTLLKAFFAPALSLSPQLEVTNTLIIIRALSLTLIFELAALIYKKELKQPLTIFFVLGFANLRFSDPNLEYYQGFHLLPWVAALIFATSYLGFLIFKSLEKKAVKWLVFALISIDVGITFALSQAELFKKIDQKKDYYINYSWQSDIGDAVRIMKGDGETLFVAPDEFLVYWQSGAKHTSKFIFYYAWMDKVDFLYLQAHSSFALKPPTYLYLSRPGTGFEQYLNRYQIVKKNGGKTGLYVLKGKSGVLSVEQKNGLQFYNFEITK